MTTYISILRGINVTGHNKMQMKELIALYESLGFKNITAYIQSGNVVFSSAKKQSPAAMAKQIETQILEKFGFVVPVLILAPEELKTVAEHNPFLKMKDIDLSRLYITFLAEDPSPDKIKNIESIDHSPDKFIISGRAVYLYCPIGYGSTKLSNNFFENKLKVKATTRNLNTVNKLIELSAKK